MPTSLDSMPAEIQLDIFRRLVPKNPDDPDRIDLANLRLTCKALRDAATDVYFEDYYLLLRKKGNVYVEPRSFQLLRRKPKLAALVRKVWIALAAAEPSWLSKCAAFNTCCVPNEDETLKLAYMATSMWMQEGEFDVHELEDDEFEDCKCDEDFSPAQYDVIREYHSCYVKPDKNRNEYGLPVSQDFMKILLNRRLRIFPNIRSIRVARPPMIETPFFKERLEFWMDNGLEEWADELCEPGPGTSCGRFPWNSLVVKSTLEQLPTTCKSLELDIPLAYSAFDDKNDMQAVFKRNSALHSQLDSLSLHIQTWIQPSQTNTDTIACPSNWVDLTNQFSSLTSLSLVNSFENLTTDNSRCCNHYASPITTFFLPSISLPNLHCLLLKSWILKSGNLSALNDRLPKLIELRLSNIVLRAPSKKPRAKQQQRSQWYKVAKSISQDFGGKCAVVFDAGPTIEIDGTLIDVRRTISDIYDPATARIMKTAALEILSAISTSGSSDTDLKKRYLDLVKHEKPDVRLNFEELEDSEMVEDFEAHTITVETPGATFIYYRVLEFDSD